MSSTDHLHDPRTGQHLTVRRSGRDTNGELLEMEVRLDPGGRVPRHAHLRQDERLTVLEGSIQVRLGRDERIVAVGEVVDVPRRTVHVVSNGSPEHARFLLEVRPARRMQPALRAIFATSAAFTRMARRIRSGSGETPWRM